MNPVPRSAYLAIIFVLLCAVISTSQPFFESGRMAVRVSGEGSHPVLIQGPHGVSFLVDPGSDASVLRFLGSHLPLWSRSLDAVILTRLNAPVRGMLEEVQERYRIARVIRLPNAGERFSIGKISLEVLYPPTTTKRLDGAVLRISYGETAAYVLRGLDEIPSWIHSTEARTGQIIYVNEKTPASTFQSDGERFETLY